MADEQRELLLILEGAKKALAEGKSEGYVNAKIEQFTRDFEQTFKSVRELASWNSKRLLAAAQPTEQEDVLLRYAEQAKPDLPFLPKGTREFAGVAAEAAPLGMGEEIMAALGPLLQSFGGPAGAAQAGLDVAGGGIGRRIEESRGERDLLRQAQEAAGEGGILNPVGLAQMAGAAAVPAAGAGAGARLLPGAPTVGRGIGGAVGGALEGGLFAAGEGGDLGDVGVGAGVGGAAGGLFAPAAGLAAGAARRLFRPSQRAGQRGVRLASSLEKSSQINKSIRTQVERTRVLKKVVQEQFYRPIEEAFGIMDDPRISTLLMDETIGAEMRRIAPDVMKAKNARFPTFREMQSVARKLRKAATLAERGGLPAELQRFGGAFDDVTGVLEEVIGPRYAAANKAWLNALRFEDAFDDGFKMFGKPAEAIELAIENYGNANAQQAFRNGMALRVTESLRKTATARPALLRMGPGVQEKLRRIFPDDASFNRFMRDFKSERSAAGREKIVSMIFRYVLPAAAIAAGAGAAGAAGARAAGGMFGGQPQ